MTIIRQATLEDLVAFMMRDEVRDLPITRVTYALLVSEVTSGRAVVAIADRAGSHSAPVAVGGVHHAAPDAPGYCWLHVCPGGLGGDLLPIVRFAKALFEHLGPLRLTAAVRDDNVNGQRLARLLGMSPTGATRAVFRQWEIDGRDWRRTDRQDSSPPSEAGGGGAARAG